ncbi:MAG: uracil-DNA glycosylase family protein [Pseudomonadales bacterium]
MIRYKQLLEEVRGCTLCEPSLEHGVRPVLQFHPQAKILVAGQAPGRKVHKTGVPFDDASGKRLREWMGIDEAVFYDPKQVAILPMGFCYPGTGKSGDLPPRTECAAAWRDSLMAKFEGLELTLLIGQYALAWHMPSATGNLTETVRDWKQHLPDNLPVPHPSPRNNIWLKRNAWFEHDVVPALQKRVKTALGKRPV